MIPFPIFLPTEELVETSFFLFWNTLCHGFLTWSISWIETWICYNTEDSIITERLISYDTEVSFIFQWPKSYYTAGPEKWKNLVNWLSQFKSFNPNRSSLGGLLRGLFCGGGGSGGGCGVGLKLLPV